MSNGEECQQNLQVLHGAFHIDLGSIFGCYVLILTTNFMWWPWNDYANMLYYIYMKINIYFSLFALQLLKTYLF